MKKQYRPIAFMLLLAMISVTYGCATSTMPVESPVQTPASPGTMKEQEQSWLTENWALVVIGIAALLIIAATAGGIIWVLRQPAPHNVPQSTNRAAPVPKPQSAHPPASLAAEQPALKPSDQPAQVSYPEPIEPEQSATAQKPSAQNATGSQDNAYLECRSEDGSTLRLTLRAPEQTIGRALDNDLVIDDRFPNYESISRYHATIRHQNGMWIIYDEGKTGQPSTNGVFVEKRQTKKNILRSGWLVEIGSVAFVFNDPGGAA